MNIVEHVYNINVDSVRNINDVKNVLKVVLEELNIGISSTTPACQVANMKHLVIPTDKDYHAVCIRKIDNYGTLITIERLVPTYTHGEFISFGSAVSQVLKRFSELEQSVLNDIAQCETKCDMNEILFKKYNLMIV